MSLWLETICKYLILLVGFSAAQVASTALLYAVESHRPIAGEVVVAQMSFKGVS